MYQHILFDLDGTRKKKKAVVGEALRRLLTGEPSAAGADVAVETVEALGEVLK